MEREAVYGLNYPARALCAVQGEKNKHLFLIGTLHPRESNEIHLVAVDEDEESVKAVQTYSHPQEVWGIQANPIDPSLFLTSYQEENDFKATLWQMPTGKGTLLEKVSFKLKSLALGMIWQPASESASQSDRVVTVQHDAINLWQVSRPEQPLAKFELKDSSATSENFFHGSWDVHHANTFVAAQGNGMSVWDLRTLQAPTQVLGRRDVVRSVDHNPNKPFYVLAAGDDRRLCVYDLRKGSQPLKVLQGHTHWAWTARYNLNHDQLLLSAGTDGAVKLWSALSVSSAPLGELEDPLNEREGDRLISSYSHEESVYSACWSAFDAWVFASLSFDGRLVVHQVPSAEKYKILL